jgi:hypothetical protein
MTSPATTRQPNSFAWLNFGLASAIISAFVLIGTNNVISNFNSIEGLLGLIFGSMWFFAAFYGFAKGFGKA